jgi:hypothetical protein
MVSQPGVTKTVDKLVCDGKALRCSIDEIASATCDHGQATELGHDRMCHYGLYSICHELPTIADDIRGLLALLGWQQPAQPHLSA